MIVTIGDRNFFPFVKRSVEQARKFHPEEGVVIYDWGFTKEQRKELQMPNVRAIFRWSFIKEPFPGAEPNSREWVLAQKPYCYRHYFKIFQPPLLFIDGDAWLLGSVKELYETQYDIVVTVRPQKDQEFGFDKCRVINSGVFFLRNEEIIEAWIKRMQTTNEYLVEQTALTRLLIEDRAFDYLALPCEIWNYYWDEEPSEEVKVRHLKGKKAKRRNR